LWGNAPVFCLYSVHPSLTSEIPPRSAKSLGYTDVANDICCKIYKPRIQPQFSRIFKIQSPAGRTVMQGIKNCNDIQNIVLSRKPLRVFWNLFIIWVACIARNS
jgi:hypothetical protein